MPFLDQFVLAARATPRAGGTFDVVGATWDTLSTPSVPIQQPEFAVLLSIGLSLHEAQLEHDITVTMTAPSGALVGQMTAHISAAPSEQLTALTQDDMVTLDAALTARGIVYPEYGRYELRILWDDTPLREPKIVTVAHVDGGIEGED